MATEMAELRLEGRDVIVQGPLCRVAHVDGEGYKFLAGPESAIAALRCFEYASTSFQVSAKTA